MAEINQSAIKRIIEDQDFIAVVDSIRSSNSRKVMSPATSSDDREKILAETWALDKLLARMREVAKD